MKFFKTRIFLTFLLFQILSLPPVLAQGNRDFMRETGKIYVVVGVILLIFIGIAAYLLRLDQKLTKLEHHIKDSKHE
jgi:CcmD family protein